MNKDEVTLYENTMQYVILKKDGIKINHENIVKDNLKSKSIELYKGKMYSLYTCKKSYIL